MLLKISERCDCEQLINYAVKKFPDVMALEIREVEEGDELPILPKNLTPVNTLQNLTFLRYAIKTSEYLNFLTLPNISCFDFALPFRSNHFDDFKNFMARHEKTEILSVLFNGTNKDAKKALDLLEHVCVNTNVKSVKLFSLYAIVLHQCLVESACVTVWRYARLGFLFQAPSS